MPRIDKRAISRHFTTGCLKQLALDLYPPNNTKYQVERKRAGMPDPQNPRPGVTALRQAGDAWEIEKYADLQNAYAHLNVLRANPDPSPDSMGRTRYKDTVLRIALRGATVGNFLIQPEYKIGQDSQANNGSTSTSSFERAMAIDNYRAQFNLTYSNLRPDIIQVLPAGTYNQGIYADGTVSMLPVDDVRLQLRVIDIKHTAEPSNGYFAEVAYYMTTLAGWLIDEGFSNEFVVVAGAVWPGSHDASTLRKKDQKARSEGRLPTQGEMDAALAEDLEPVAFPVFAPRLRRFLQEDLKTALETPWQDLPFYVRTSCGHCEYLGVKWADSVVISPDHCLPIVQRTQDLSQIYNLSPGARQELRDAGIDNLPDMAILLPSDAALDRHQTLRSKRVIFPARAQSLQNGTPAIPSGAGTSSVMPKWADLSIFVSTDFDMSSGITVAFGLRSTWMEHVPYGEVRTQEPRAWPPFTPGAARNNAFVFLIDNRDLMAERRELLAFLESMQTVLDDVATLDAASIHNVPGKPIHSSFQLYLWDSLQLKHLQRVVGRHLPAILANPRIAPLTWLFPPETVLPSHELQRPSPITLVQEAVSNLAALPIPHYYTLLNTVKVYHREDKDVTGYAVHPLFDGPLSDQIPSERAHEIWSRSTVPGRHWTQQLQIYQETVAKKLQALSEVTWTLQRNMGSMLQEKAPPLQIRLPRARGKMSFDGELLYAFAKLDACMNEAKTLAVRAMPPYEREAKFESALLTRRLTGTEEARVLTDAGLPALPNRRVYELAPGSVSVKMKPGDFSFALSPGQNASFLNQNCRGWIPDNSALQPLVNADTRRRWKMEELTGVTIKFIDREKRLIVLDISLRDNVDFVAQLEKEGLADFSKNLSVDPVSRDFFTRKLEDCITSIGNPPEAVADPEDINNIMLAIGQMKRKGGRPSATSPAADFLWNARTMDTAPVIRLPGASTDLGGSASLNVVQTALEKRGVTLTATQWDAWRKALITRLQVIWGPPGTGKSRTLHAIIVGAFVAAIIAKTPLRVLVSAFTYQAVDIVLENAYKTLSSIFSDDSFVAARLRSKWQGNPDAEWAQEIDCAVNKDNPSTQVQSLVARIMENEGYTLVGSPPEQVYNLTQLTGSTQAEMFDLIVIDEATQMDVAHAILPFCALAESGSVVLAGDPKQLPPIHQAEPPLGLETHVGSIYRYMTEAKGIEQSMLDRNYRSNDTLVGFALEAGYQRTLTSHSPDLRLGLVPVPDRDKDDKDPPPDWPQGLFWTPAWERMMDPNLPAVCFVYADGRSSQWNDFEVEAVAALIQTIDGRVMSNLRGEYDADGQLIACDDTLYTPDQFWRRGIGVVTPHRAQQSRIVSRLQALFGSKVSDPSIIRDAVDTVERFQGQQRDIIIASFALGDPDAIREEEEFLMSLNRFNVMASRARAKLVVLVSREVIDYLANDLDVLRESALLKLYADSYCSNITLMQLGYINSSGQVIQRPGSLRYRSISSSKDLKYEA